MVGGIIAAVTRVTVAAPRCEVERRAMDASRTRFIPDRLLGLFELTTWPSDGGGHRGACCEPGAAHRRRRSYARNVAVMPCRIHNSVGARMNVPAGSTCAVASGPKCPTLRRDVHWSARLTDGIPG